MHQLLSSELNSNLQVPEKRDEISDASRRGSNEGKGRPVFTSTNSCIFLCLKSVKCNTDAFWYKSAMAKTFTIRSMVI